MHDRFISHPDRVSRHSTTVNGTPERVWPSVRALDMSCSPIIRVLFALRGIRARTLTDMERSGFGLLEEIPGRFLAVGMIGRPWQPSGGLVRFGNAQEWADFDDPGYAKISWTFVLEIDGADTAVSTETRVKCTDDASRKTFFRYWKFVGPFSSLIRREMLRCLRRGRA